MTLTKSFYDLLLFVFAGIPEDSLNRIEGPLQAQTFFDHDPKLLPRVVYNFALNLIEELPAKAWTVVFLRYLLSFGRCLVLVDRYAQVCNCWQVWWCFCNGHSACSIGHLDDNKHNSHRSFFHQHFTECHPIYHFDLGCASVALLALLALLEFARMHACMSGSLCVSTKLIKINSSLPFV